MNYVIKQMSEVGGIYFLNLYSVIEKDSKLVVKEKKKNPIAHEKWMTYALKNSTKVFGGWGTNNNNKTQIKLLKKLLKENKFKVIYKFTDINDKHTHPSRCTIESVKEIKIQNI